MPAKENCASAWANHTARRSGQNGGSRTATLDTSGVVLSTRGCSSEWYLVVTG
jgi:hypothetical protein